MMYIDMHRLFRLAFQIHLTWILWTDSFNEERGWWDGGLSKQWKHPPGKSQQHECFNWPQSRSETLQIGPRYHSTLTIGNWTSVPVPLQHSALSKIKPWGQWAYIEHSLSKSRCSEFTPGKSRFKWFCFPNPSWSHGPAGASCEAVDSGVAERRGVQWCCQ